MIAPDELLLLAIAICVKTHDLAEDIGDGRIVRCSSYRNVLRLWFQIVGGRVRVLDVVRAGISVWRI